MPSTEVTRLSAMLQAPVLGYRRGRGMLDSRDPLSVTLPLAHEMWREADVVIGIGTRLLLQLTAWGVDKDLKVIRVDADPDEPDRVAQARGVADRRCRADAARTAQGAAEAQHQAQVAQGRDGRAAGQAAKAPGEAGAADRPSSTSSAPNCPKTAFSSTR